MPYIFSFGVAHHKSQGCNVDRVVLGVENRERHDGWTILALSRCRIFGGMLVEELTLKRLLNFATSRSVGSRLADLHRMRAIGARLGFVFNCLT